MSIVAVMCNASHKPCRLIQIRGFTLIELLITIVMVAVLAAVAVPSMRTYVLNSRLTATAQELLRSLQTARGEATKRQHNIVVCASSNPQATLPTCTTGNDATGWIVFQDYSTSTATTNNDWEHASGEELIESHSFDTSKMYMLLDGSKRVSFAGTGFANTSTGTITPTTSIVMCDSRGNTDGNGSTSGSTSVARGLIITNTGRARITNVLSDIHTLLDSAHINSNCPP